ncbi:MAG: GntR family transcriptional regulator [Burkholderiaceae bacterium]|nr:GntR family transcriptional regulator [Burkholderiaceae bacterium]
MIENQQPDVFSPLFRVNHSGIPKYRLVLNAIMEGITSGLWKAGDKLPTEDELVQLTPFSLGTVQRALRILVDQGVVIRQHGLGTFVAGRQLQVQDPWHCRFIADDGVSFLPVYSTILSRDYVPDKGELTRYFDPADGPLALIERIININDEFNVFTRFYIHKNMFPLLWDTPLEKLKGLNFKRQITKELNMPITRVDHSIRMVGFDEDVARHTSVQPGSMGMCLTVAAYMGLDKCIYFQRFFIPPTERTLSIPSQLTD